MTYISLKQFDGSDTGSCDAYLIFPFVLLGLSPSLISDW